MPDAVVAGHICVDLLPTLRSAPVVEPGALAEVGELRISLGGCVANTGLALAELGVPTRLVADVGDDVLGDVVVSTLPRYGVDARGVTRRPAGTTSYSIVVEPPGRERTFWHHVGANASFDGQDVDVRDADVLHVGYPSLLPALCADLGDRWKSLLVRAREFDVTTSVDFAAIDPRSDAATLDWAAVFASVLPLTDVVSPAAGDVATALGLPAPTDPDGVLALACRLLEFGAAAVLLTAGASGMLLATGPVERLRSAGRALAAAADAWAGRVIWAPAADVPVVQTTGAGDAASAGLLHAILEGAAPEAAVAIAARVAGARVAGRPLGTAPLGPAPLGTAPLGPAPTGPAPIGALRAMTPPVGWLPGSSGLLRGPGDATNPTRLESTC